MAETLNVQENHAGANVKPGVILARDPARAMQEMMDIIDNLHGIIDEETRALENADTRTFLGLQQKKLTAAQAYHDGAVQIINRREDFSGVREVFKKNLEQKQAAFNESTRNNMKKLKSISRGVQRMSKLLMDNAREQGQKKQSLFYTHGGHIEDASKRTVSIGINESA